jgi:hypothetical protein
MEQASKRPAHSVRRSEWSVPGEGSLTEDPSVLAKLETVELWERRRHSRRKAERRGDEHFDLLDTRSGIERRQRYRRRQDRDGGF